jgi:hypothetical protein
VYVSSRFTLALYQKFCFNHHVDIKDYLKNPSAQIQESSLLKVEEMKELLVKCM